jgi:hypothetical protein
LVSNGRHKKYTLCAVRRGDPPRRFTLYCTADGNITESTAKILEVAAFADRSQRKFSTLVLFLLLRSAGFKQCHVQKLSYLSVGLPMDLILNFVILFKLFHFYVS